MKNMHDRLIILFAVVAAPFVAAAPVAAQTLETYARAGWGRDPYGVRRTICSEYGTDYADEGCGHDSTCNGNDVFFDGWASAAATYGQLDVTAEGAGNYPGDHHVGGSARWTDSLVIIGGSGSGTVTFTASCVATYSGNGNAGVSLLMGGVVVAAGANVSGTYQRTESFSFGQPFPWSCRIMRHGETMLELDGSCGTMRNGDLEVSFDLMEVVVRDGEGNVLPHAIVRGESGTQYLGPEPEPVVRIKPDAPDFQLGTDWAAATTLWWALQLTKLPGDLVQEIWFGQGTYTPRTSTGSRCASIRPADGVGHFGGFGGFESSRAQRDWTAHPTILSGDLNGDDLPDFGNRDDNSNHVIRGDGLGPGTILDGFAITGGQGTGDAGCYVPHWGGAILLGSSHVAVRNCSFTGNLTGGRGGAVQGWGGSPSFDNCTFEGNETENGGGAIHQSGGTLTLNDCTFADNRTTSQPGGAIKKIGGTLLATNCTFTGNNYRAVIGDNMTLTGCHFEGNGAGADVGNGSVVRSCQFIGNSTGANGGALCGGASRVEDCVFIGNSGATGGALCSGGGGPLLVSRCLFQDNQADHGGAAYVSNTRMVNCRLTGNMADSAAAIQSSGDLELVGCLLDHNSAPGSETIFVLEFSDPGSSILNCTIIDNQATGLFSTMGDFTLLNSIVRGNDAPQVETNSIWGEAIVAFNNIEGGYAGDGNIDSDPLFADPAAGNYRLTDGSSCIDAGDSSAVPSDWADLDDDGITSEMLPLDLDEQTRRTDDPTTPDSGVGPAPIVDMGAYEFGQTSCPADLTGDGEVDVDDLVAVIMAWGSTDPSADATGDAEVDVEDLVAIILGWGPCT